MDQVGSVDLYQPEGRPRSSFPFVSGWAKRPSNRVQPSKAYWLVVSE